MNSTSKAPPEAPSTAHSSSHTGEAHSADDDRIQSPRISKGRRAPPITTPSRRDTFVFHIIDLFGPEKR